MVTSGPALAITPGETAIEIILLVAFTGEAQLNELVKITFTCALLVKVEVVNVLLLVPALTPLTCHW